MSYVLSHTRLGFCWLDLVALIVLIIVIAWFVLKYREMKQKEKELEDEISQLCADDTVPIETEA